MPPQDRLLPGFRVIGRILYDQSSEMTKREISDLVYEACKEFVGQRRDDPRVVAALISRIIELLPKPKIDITVEEIPDHE